MNKYSVKAENAASNTLFQANILAQDEHEAYETAYSLAYEEGVHLDQHQVHIDLEEAL